MNNYREQFLSALEKLIGSNSIALSKDDIAILEKSPDESKQHNKRVGEIYEIVFSGFFLCAAKGTALCPEEKVAEKFGNSIEENYPEASESFLKFAKTYWTLRVLVYDLMEADMGWIGAHLLGKLEQDIGPVFFPFLGPKKIAPSEREKFQRELLEEFGKDINIEKFMKGNPILIRDRGASIMKSYRIIPIIWGSLCIAAMFGLLRFDNPIASLVGIILGLAGAHQIWLGISGKAKQIMENGSKGDKKV